MLHKGLRICSVVFLAVIVTVVHGRRSPHAAFIQRLSYSQQDFSDSVIEDALLDVPGLIAKYGYPQEVHHVTTSDGYILEAHRIPHGRNRSRDSNKPIAFLMHGLHSSSADFLVLGPGNALGYLLADAGYDVWLGNARGNYYSRSHNFLNPDSFICKKFWKFSWDQIGNIDVATFVDYILHRTGQSKLHYIGHSQGGTSFLVHNSLRPEYNDKFISFQGLAPASFFVHNERKLYKLLAPLERVIETGAFLLGIGEIFGSKKFTKVMTTYCHDYSNFGPDCRGAFHYIINMDYLNTTMIPIIVGHAPAGSSIRQVAHYGQLISSKKFCRFNYRILGNLVAYGQVSPPEYDLSQITVPSYLHYGLSDVAVNHRDVLLLARKLSNTIGVYQVERPSFGHLDFVWSTDAKESVYDKVIGYMREAEQL